MADDLRSRSAAEVFVDHLRLAGEHRFEEDIERNISPEVVILEHRGIFRGREGARELARLLEEDCREHLMCTRTASWKAAWPSSSGLPKAPAPASATEPTRSSSRMAGSWHRPSITPSGKK